MTPFGASATAAWMAHLDHLIHFGAPVGPRGKATRELIHRTIHVDMRWPVIVAPARKLNYRFMAAEAYWILTGSDRVDGVAPYNPHIAQFSDDGETFFGAYGVRFHEQLAHVVSSLIKDPATRQAGLTLWRPSPPPTKDVPCTVAMWFYLRDDALHTSVFMRSSDAWLGVPYDIFSFTTMTALVAAKLRVVGIKPALGTLSLTMGSAHLYESNLTEAQALLEGRQIRFTPECIEMPEVFTQGAPVDLLAALKALRDTRPGDPLRWWEEEV